MKKLVKTFKNSNLLAKDAHFAIADIHGHAVELELLLGKVNFYRTQNPQDNVTLVIAGDLINRGPDSNRVLEVLSAEKQKADTRYNVVFLRGNHDQSLLDFLKETHPLRIHAAGLNFLRAGGVTTLASYGFFLQGIENANRGVTLDMLRDVVPASEVARAHDFLKLMVPQHHISLLHSAQTSYSYQHPDRYYGLLFCHGGIDTKRLIDKQEEKVLIGRDYRQGTSRKFIQYNGPAICDSAGIPWMVVHGHTIAGEKPALADGRISIDTGCYEGKRLTCAVFENGILNRFLQQPSLYAPYDYKEIPVPEMWPPVRLRDEAVRSLKFAHNREHE